MSRNRVIFGLAVLGVLGGGVTAVLSAARTPPQPPVFNPAANPYARGIFANGIVESYQANGQNVSIFPEVSGRVTAVAVAEGAQVHAGDPLLSIDDSIPRATADQAEAQAAAAQALLADLQAQPRPEALAVAKSQAEAAAATMANARAQQDRQVRSHELDPRSVSQDVLDSAIHAFNIAQANFLVADRQYQLVAAGAWSYDVQNQRRQALALAKAAQAAHAQLVKHTVRAPVDGAVLAVQTAEGAYVSPQGAYNAYTQGFGPVVVMASADPYLAVRCYVDEVLIPRLPAPSAMRARLFVRGTDVSLPLEFVRIQPYVTPKIQLSNERTERVDLRVLPLVFRFARPRDARLFLGQLVDIYIGTDTPAAPAIGLEEPPRRAR
jgi:HlyD family secretion protein